jgi:hypothetical protein
MIGTTAETLPLSFNQNRYYYIDDAAPYFLKFCASFLIYYPRSFSFPGLSAKIIAKLEPFTRTRSEFNGYINQIRHPDHRR